MNRFAILGAMGIAVIVAALLLNYVINRDEVGDTGTPAATVAIAPSGSTTAPAAGAGSSGTGTAGTTQGATTQGATTQGTTTQGTTTQGTATQEPAATQGQAATNNQAAASDQTAASGQTATTGSAGTSAAAPVRRRAPPATAPAKPRPRPQRAEIRRLPRGCGPGKLQRHGHRGKFGNGPGLDRGSRWARPPRRLPVRGRRAAPARRPGRAIPLSPRRKTRPRARLRPPMAPPVLPARRPRHRPRRR